MKFVTNILLVASLVVYVFLPIFDVAFDGGWTGFSYTADTLTNSENVTEILFALLPYVACFGAIAFNCMKHRNWGWASSVLIVIGLCFFIEAHQFKCVCNPEFYQINSVTAGFYVSYGLMVLALASAAVSLLPLPFNLLHEPELLARGKKMLHLAKR